MSSEKELSFSTLNKESSEAPESSQTNIMEAIARMSAQLSQLTLAAQSQGDLLSKVSMDTRILKQSQEDTSSRISKLEL